MMANNSLQKYRRFKVDGNILLVPKSDTLECSGGTKRKRYRKIWEQYHKASLLSWSEVHHKDYNHNNNNPNNLEAMIWYKHFPNNHRLEHQIQKIIDDILNQDSP